MSILKFMENEYLLFDGAMGSILQQGGLKAGALPENLNLSNEQLIVDIHMQYLNSGANVITTNTFGANPVKYQGQPYSLSAIISSAINNAQRAITQCKKEAYIAYDIGPLGALLKPSGTLSFEEAYEYYKEIILEVVKHEVDVILLETMSDLHEVKAAILTIKEHSNLPIFATMTFESNMRTLVGNDVASVVATLSGLGVNAIGLNCSFGPKEMLPLIKEFTKYSSLPIMVQPNAGMPLMKNGVMSYDIDAYSFQKDMALILESPVQIIGGCCGTEPNHIMLLSQLIKNHTFVKPIKKDLTIISSSQKAVIFNNEFIKIGERINPTGKPLIKEALINKSYQYIIKEALLQEEQQAHILDINVGLPKIDEALLMKEVIEAIQTYTSLPLQIDSSDFTALEAGMRIYNGKPMVNSVNGKASSMNAIFPLVKKYGGLVLGLCIDEDGLAYTAQKKLEVATKIVNTALSYGIDKNDIIIDTLTLTASAQQKDVKATLDAITLIKEQLNVLTILGVSNVSFGLPHRDIINASFINMALYAGLDACIINPASKPIKEAISSSAVLLNKDIECIKYLKDYQNIEKTINNNHNDLDLYTVIIKGYKQDAKAITKTLLKDLDPLTIIETIIVPALNFVGEQFQLRKLYLPQLIQSAETVSHAFQEIKEYYITHNKSQKSKDKIILATVKGDVHDIGKNIVKVLLENYGYDIIDLGKDVSSAVLLNAIKEHNVKLIGLSALMTTTVASMEIMIAQVKEHYPEVAIMVGGAVLTQEYANSINADYYCSDALQGVTIAQSIYK